jgi:hypothetical protein
VSTGPGYYARVVQALEGPLRENSGYEQARLEIQLDLDRCCPSPATSPRISGLRQSLAAVDGAGSLTGDGTGLKAARPARVEVEHVLHAINVYGHSLDDLASRALRSCYVQVKGTQLPGF